MRIVRAAIASLALIAGALVAAPAESASADVPASNPIQYLTQNFWGDTGNSITSGTVSCPNGSRVTSSGASNAGVLVGIIPSYDYTSATVSALHQGWMTVTVGCEQTTQMSEVTSRDIALPLGTGFRRGVVYCPPGYHAFGGGGAFIGPFGRASTESFGMVSNTVSADGTGWTFAGYTNSTTDRLYVRTQCAPLRGSTVAANSVPVDTTSFNQVNVFAPCPAGFTALSGGVYLSTGDGNEVHIGMISSSTSASGNRWWVKGISYDGGSPLATQKLVALTQCIR